MAINPDLWSGYAVLLFRLIRFAHARAAAVRAKRGVMSLYVVTCTQGRAYRLHGYTCTLYFGNVASVQNHAGADWGTNDTACRHSLKPSFVAVLSHKVARIAPRGLVRVAIKHETSGINAHIPHQQHRIPWAGQFALSRIQLVPAHGLALRASRAVCHVKLRAIRDGAMSSGRATTLQPARFQAFLGRLQTSVQAPDVLG